CASFRLTMTLALERQDRHARSLFGIGDCRDGASSARGQPERPLRRGEVAPARGNANRAGRLAAPFEPRVLLVDARPDERSVLFRARWAGEIRDERRPYLR